MVKKSTIVQDSIAKEMRAYKKGRWESRDQAIAVGFSKAREQGARVPKKKGDNHAENK